MEEGKKKGRSSLQGSFATGAIALVFLIIGYEVALFVHKAAVTRIEANRDRPDTVYIYSYLAEENVSSSAKNIADATEETFPSANQQTDAIEGAEDALSSAKNIADATERASSAPVIIADATDKPSPALAAADETAGLHWRTDKPGLRVKNIRSGISLYDRALFIGSLFKEDFSLYEKTIADLNEMVSMDQAVDYIRSRFPDWNLKSDVVYNFMMSVRKKLG